MFYLMSLSVMSVRILFVANVIVDGDLHLPQMVLRPLLQIQKQKNSQGVSLSLHSSNGINRFILYENGKAIEVNKPYLLENLDKAALYDLTLVVPAYNEEKRLPVMMNETLEVILALHLFPLVSRKAD